MNLVELLHLDLPVFRVPHAPRDLKGQLRFAVSENNLYAYLFGIKNPIAHVMGYFVSILRERIANFEAPAKVPAFSSSEGSHAATV